MTDSTSDKSNQIYPTAWIRDIDGNRSRFVPGGYYNSARKTGGILLMGALIASIINVINAMLNSAQYLSVYVLTIAIICMSGLSIYLIFDKYRCEWCKTPMRKIIEERTQFHKGTNGKYYHRDSYKDQHLLWCPVCGATEYE